MGAAPPDPRASACCRYGVARLGTGHAMDPAFVALGDALAARQDGWADPLHRAWRTRAAARSLRTRGAVASDAADRMGGCARRLRLYRIGRPNQERARPTAVVELVTRLVVRCAVNNREGHAPSAPDPNGEPEH